MTRARTVVLRTLLILAITGLLWIGVGAFIGWTVG